MSEIVTRLRNIIPGSNKPILKTVIDAAVITVLTLIVTVMIFLVWNQLFSSDVSTDWFTVIWQTIALSVASQFLNEYSGANALLAESSMRYAKNRPLNKFRTVRSAACYNEYRIQHEYMGVDANVMNNNLDKLLTILRLDIVRKMLILHNKGLSDEEIYNKISDRITPSEFDNLLHLCENEDPWGYLRASKEITEHLDHDDVIRYILLNGFCDFSYGNVTNAVAAAKDSARTYYAKLSDDLAERIYGVKYKKRIAELQR